MDKAINYILSCKNLDGGFGCTPGGESHAGQSRFYNLPYLFTDCQNILYLISMSIPAHVYMLAHCFAEWPM